MYIEQLNSGSYRITQTFNKKRYRVTVDHKPSTKEATILISREMEKFHDHRITSSSFAGAYRRYADDRSNVCSPSTLRSYEQIVRNMPEWFSEKNIYDIEQMDVQRLVNEYSKTLSPKSVRNIHGLIAGVMKMARPEVVLRTKLPSKKVESVYIPSDDEVEAILRAVKGTKYEIPLHLAVFGLRRSEICALTIDDLDGNFITVNKAKVQNPDQSWTIKQTPKTAESNRRVFITDYVRDLILQQGYIYNGHPEHIKTKLEKTEKELGIPHFTLHKLRHYYASMAHEMGICDADIMAMGGWKTDNIMKTVYRHARENSVSEGQRAYAERISKMAI